MQKLRSFEQNVVDSLKGLLGGRWPKVLGVAVSGGADSVSLLRALCAFQKTPQAQETAAPPSNGDGAFKIVCVTVDHSIRPEAETAGDAAFVQDLCARLGVACAVKKIPRGLVERTAAERGKGLEEAARFLRYQEFEAFAKESGAQYICLAHNQNDFLETVLMRFLQGSSSAGMGGIAAARGIYLRPLLGTSRAQIEEYLTQEKIEWRTDSTNCDNNYFRNKIRNLLIPLLDKNFDGWKKALLSGAEKAAYEDEALEGFLRGELEKGGNFSQAQEGGGQVEISRGLFEGLPVALRQRLLYRAFDALRPDSRVPYSFVREVALWPEKDFKNISAAGLEASSKKDKVFIKKSQKEATESGFFDIIMEDDSASGAFVIRGKAVGDKL